MSTISARVRRAMTLTAAGLLAAASISTAAHAETAGPSSAAADGSTSSAAPSTPAPGTASPTSASPAPTSATATTATPTAEASPSTSTATSSSKPAPSTSAPNSQAPTSSAAAPTSEAKATSAAGNNPEGYLGAWSANDGLIYFTGYAFDRDDFSQKVTTFYTLDGTVVAYQIAQLRSQELDPYGLPSVGVFGAVQAPTAGQHQICMFGGNIGPGQSGIISCFNVYVAQKDPRGDIMVDTPENQIRINGWLLDDSNPQQSLGLWIFDNGRPIAYFVSNAASPYLYPYGVFGNHAFGYMYSPSTSGSHQICVLGANIGFGQNAWIECADVTVDTAASDPWGVMYLSAEDPDSNGLTDFFVYGVAWDPNVTWPVRVGLFLDGQLMPIDYPDWIADLDYSDLNPPGITGKHGYDLWIGEEGYELAAGNHEVCLYVYNQGPGTGQLVQCEYFTV
ncbi:hypothetical protein [Cumulibacter manganitolerans]|uniref:hypothetical protein n=1 Tax=Cumulibacter manganitolerans TaxID=1884992 RepID=UPI001295F7ED|nr:hypothetical protein [Cumulibacter manganitolerans]